jgi:CubicO group peptidase (beta-lactamase class C family)
MNDPYVTREITVRDLVCHRSGLETFEGDLVWYGTNYSRDEVIRRIRYLKPAYSFRSHYGYQNLMYLAAGQIIPAVTGKSWDEYLNEKILVPLNMNSTNTSIKNFKPEDDVAMPHAWVNGKLVQVPYRDVDNVGPAASMNSSVTDIAQWIKLQLNKGNWNGKQIYSVKAAKEMWTPQTILPFREDSLTPSRHFSAYGLGWFIKDYHGRKIMEHGGGMDGMISRTVLIPEDKLGFVILTNSINSIAGPLSYKILDTFFGAPDFDWSKTMLESSKKYEAKKKEQLAKIDSARVKNTKPSLALQQYTGTYGGDLYGNAQVTIEKDHLVVSFIPTATYIADLEHWNYDSFRIQMRDPSLSEKGFVNFIIDEKGKCVEMKVDIPNPDFDFTELTFKRLN